MIFILSEYFWLLCLLPSIWLFFKYSLVDQSIGKKLASFLLINLAFIFLIISLARPVIKITSNAKHINFLVDVSRSVELTDIKMKFQDIKKTIRNLKSDDSYNIFIFGKFIKKIPVDQFENKIDNIIKNRSTEELLSSESNLENAVLESRLYFPDGKNKKIILYTDGRQTIGALNNTKEQLTKENIILEVFAVKGIETEEAYVENLTPSSETAFEGERVRLTSSIRMNYDGKIKVKFVYDGVVDKAYDVDVIANQSKEINHDVIMYKNGINVWRVEISPIKDLFLINNSFSCFIDVKGKPSVLAIHQNEQKLRVFKKAMEAQNIRVDVRGKFGMPNSLSKMLEYDAILIADLPATLLSMNQMNDLKSYVNDFGGGLIMTGSENSFGLGGYFRTPVEDVLPIISRYEKEKEKSTVAMVLVIDKSGSMEGVPIQLAKQAAKSSIELLNQNDYGGVIGFDSDAYVFAPLTAMSSRYTVTDAIDTIAAGGGTNMYPAMVKGKELLEASNTKIKHMILLGDGQSEAGQFLEIATEMASLGMTLSTIALGDGADRDLFKAIAENGKGRYYETNDPESVPQIFTKETMEASKSAIKETPFVPIKIGKHMMLENIVFEKSPYLLGYVMTKAKPTASMQLLTEEGDPLLAIGQYGLGKGVAFSSDITDKWASQWLEWDDFGKLWAQIIRASLRKENKDGIRIQKNATDHQIQLNLSQTDERNILQVNQNWSLNIKNQNGFSDKKDLNIKGYGIYGTQINLLEEGLYSFKFINQQTQQTITTHYQKNYPKEYYLGAPIDPYFLSLSQKNTINQSTECHTYKDISYLFMLIALTMVLISILLRRL